MIYQGTSANETGEDTQIGTSAFNSSSYDNAHVGYMYTIGQRQGTGSSSTIKVILDTWYNNNLATNYGQYIDGNSGFCGDRRVTSQVSYTEYQTVTRIYNSSPSLTCETLDIYTTEKANNGNGALTYPIGLISADEAMFAGIPNGNISNCNSFLCTRENYWTMSPYAFISHQAYALYVFGDGGFTSWDTDGMRGVRPVINIRADVSLTGSGTTSDPFKVAGAS